MTVSFCCCCSCLVANLFCPPVPRGFPYISYVFSFSPPVSGGVGKPSHTGGLLWLSFSTASVNTWGIARQGRVTDVSAVVFLHFFGENVSSWPRGGGGGGCAARPFCLCPEGGVVVPLRIS